MNKTIITKSILSKDPKYKPYTTQNTPERCRGCGEILYIDETTTNAGDGKCHKNRTCTRQANDMLADLEKDPEYKKNTKKQNTSTKTFQPTQDLPDPPNINTRPTLVNCGCETCLIDKTGKNCCDTGSGAFPQTPPHTEYTQSTTGTYPKTQKNNTMKRNDKTSPANQKAKKYGNKEEKMADILKSKKKY